MRVRSWLESWPVFRQLTGDDPFGLTDQQFVENLVQVLAPSVLPSGRRTN